MQLTEIQKKQLEAEVTFSASRSSGPGGQNVNKVNSQVELRFNILNTTLFSEEEKQRIRLKIKNKINTEGILILTSQTSRSQLENREIALQKFFGMIEKALTMQKKRIKSKPTATSIAKRLESKKFNALKKLYRKPPES